jgi:unsaturated chondroitin disaccharide hydrolase
LHLAGLKLESMKKTVFLVSITFLTLSVFGQERNSKSMSEIIKESLDFSVKQYMLMANTLKDSAGQLPRTADWNSKLIPCRANWWTSGFFPGSLWYLYEYSGNEELKKMASMYTRRVEAQKNATNTHDLGFVLYCSFGNGLRLTDSSSYKDVLITGAKSLSTRFRPIVGCIQSWDINGGRKRLGWQCPVIIDNMMNLELMCEATKLSGDSTFYKIAVSHANTTMKNHFRQDYSSYHVVDYNPETGEVNKRITWQGYSDESAWSRGQGWALYGYTMMYRETGNRQYLDEASHIADFIINNTTLPADKIPYWDFDAPHPADVYRDASAGAVICSALIELSQYVEKSLSEKYINIAEQQIRSLSSPAFRADFGKNADFILKHSVGFLFSASEVDVPLSYADYYYIEALMRYKKLILKNKLD